MDPIGNWIVPAIEHCLSSYQEGLDTADTSLGLEDDGSNLRFTNPIERLALVDDYRPSGIPILTLMDDRAQIEAILSSESLNTYYRDSLNRPLGKSEVRRYCIRLIDFELVFEYSTSEPNIHLFVKQFAIEWDRGRATSVKVGRKYNKHGSIESMMRVVFEDIKKRQEQSGATSPVGDSDESLGSQNDPESVLPETGISEENFMSQIPSGHHPLTSNNAHDVKRGPPTASTGLLGHLGPGVNLPGRFPLGKDTNRHEADLPNALSSTVMREEKQPSDSPPKDTDDHPIPVNIRESPAASAMEITPARNETQVSGAIVNKDPSLVKTNAEPEPVVESPKRSNQKSVEVEKASSPPARHISKDPEAEKSFKQSSPDQLDYWHGLTKIRSRDVKISKDQNTLIEDNRCWFPPLTPNSMPQAHVPIHLLAQWNQIALHKSRLAQEKEQRSKVPRAETPNNRGSSPDVASPASQSDSESASEHYSWPPSPPRDPRPRPELPVDSSPVSGRQRARKSDSPRTGDQLPGSTDVGIDVDNKQNQRLTSEPPGEHRLSAEGGVQIDNQPEPGKTDTSEPITTAESHLPEESDSESNESVMDAAIPCPLGYSSQPAMPNDQSEQEPTSSGPSLPRLDTNEHVQVVETPAADLGRLRFEEPGNKNVGGFEQQSSQAAKSSSQSRIFNTYGSNDNASKFGPSQEPHYSSQNNGDNDSNEVDVMGTQISSGNWTMHGTTPNSQSAFVPNSSGPNAREPSVPLPISATQAEGTPQPFSSYRDVPLFPSDDGSLGPSFQSPTQEASIERTLESIRAPSLKRLASVMEVDEPSPSKRYKTDQDTHRNKSKDPMSNTMSRRQSYIGSTAKGAEAMRAYEKFRTDYPSYTGDFAHFIKLCSKLQALRNTGQLKRSFLWDDFVIMHLEQYPSYLQLCTEMEAKIMEYEEYFGSHFSKPTYKKRSLTVTGIEVAAAEHIAMSRLSATASPFATRGDANGSFTAGLVDKLSHFHAHSFGPGIESNRSDAEGDPMSGIPSSPTPHGTSARDTNAPTQRFTVEEHTFDLQSSREIPHEPTVHEPTTVEVVDTGADEHVADESVAAEQAVDESIANQPVSDEAMDYDSAADDPASKQLQMENLTSGEPIPNEAMGEGPTVDNQTTDEDSEMEMTLQTPQRVSGDHENETAHSIPESEHGDDNNDGEEEVEYDEMEATHETASIELGEDEPSTAPQELQSDGNQAESSSEAESINENWFDSLRHLRPPTGPVWSDDPNTPFKLWARADQNVKTEVRRRGNRYRDVDKNGVIQRSTHPAH